MPAPGETSRQKTMRSAPNGRRLARPMVSAARGIDPRLQKRSDRLVPKKTDEPAFWRCYFGHLHAVLNGLEMTEATPGGGGAAAAAGASEADAELSAEERKTYEAAGLPPPRYA